MKYVLIIILFIFCFILYSAEINYAEYFSDDYKRALEYVEINKNNISKKIYEYDCDINILITVIFPELIRYSILRDKMEITGLKIFYINLGDTQSDFSIGRFQMKPSFVKLLEEYSVKLEIDNKYKLSKYNTVNEKEIRQQRIQRLENETWQIKYLCCFYDIISILFSDQINEMNIKERILFFSSAYNAGFNKSFKEIKESQDYKYFPYGKKSPFNNVGYSDVALYYYRTSY